MLTPSTDHYWLRNAHIPVSVLTASQPELIHPKTSEDLCLLDLEILNGTVQTIAPSTPNSIPPTPHSALRTPHSTPSHDLRGGIIVPCFVDVHTHLDKGHIWFRAPNPDGTFASAMTSVGCDSRQHWDANDVYRRMKFGLQCSYAHGTQAVRTHIDSWGEQADISLGVFTALQQEWADRLIMQAVCLIPLEEFLTPRGEYLADRLASMKGGVLGGLPLMQPELAQHLDRVMQLAQERNLDLDFHADETLDPTSNTLYQIAEAAVRNQFTGRITCGHCCSLAMQAPGVVSQTLNLLKQATMSIVSLPMCNLYLQDRQAAYTPRYRGITLIQELRQAGIPVAIASDNCRDPFYGFGDHDMLEVLTMGVRVAQLDAPYGDVPTMVSRTPADIMGLKTVGRIGMGLPADLVLFRGRNFSELLSRSQHDRVVLRQGQAIDTALPNYAELDDL